jgi:hypothetical protein
MSVQYKGLTWRYHLRSIDRFKDMNDMGGDIWRSLEDGLSPEAISSEIASRGVDRQQAVEHVDAAVRQWERRGLIGLPPTWFSTSSRGQVSQVVAVPGCRVQIVYPTGHAFPAIAILPRLSENIASTLRCFFDQMEHQAGKKGVPIVGKGEPDRPIIPLKRASGKPPSRDRRTL